MVLDDLGTKVQMHAVANLPPSWLLETSDRNFQAGYLLKGPITDVDLADRLISALADKELTDKGAQSVTRYVRLPVGRNTKPKCGPGGFPNVLHEWHPDRVYTVDQLIEAFGLNLHAVAEKQRQIGPVLPLEQTAADPYLRALEAEGLVLSGIKSNGWVDILCPWRDEHTDAPDTGAAYHPGGGFKCHHGHCKGRGIPNLKRWLASKGYDTVKLDKDQWNLQHPPREGKTGGGDPEDSEPSSEGYKRIPKQLSDYKTDFRNADVPRNAAEAFEYMNERFQLPTVLSRMIPIPIQKTAAARSFVPHMRADLRAFYQSCYR